LLRSPDEQILLARGEVVDGVHVVERLT
jgi:hypothetical protein